jgi:hypothetical protein
MVLVPFFVNNYSATAWHRFYMAGNARLQTQVAEEQGSRVTGSKVASQNPLPVRSCHEVKEPSILSRPTKMNLLPQVTMIDGYVGSLSK